MKLSFAIQAHPKRKEWAEELAEILKCPIAWDTDNTVWNTRKKALLLAEKDADYHLVIQDDALLCKGFKEKAIGFLKKLKYEKIENVAVQFYYGNRVIEKPRVIEDGFNKGFIIKNFLCWGVAIATPVSWIDEMIKFGDSFYAWQDDTKIKHFLAKKGYRTVFPLPCLVDHRRQHTNPTLVASRDSDRYSQYFIDGKQKEPTDKIPQIIHQIWIGDKNQKPENLMDTWKIKGWDYMLWTEKEIDELNLENRKLYDYFYNKKCFYGCSDIVRLEVLRKYGGVYIDADTERLAPIDELLRDIKFFAVWSNKKERIANGIIGSSPEHPIIENYIKAMYNADKIEPVWSTIGGTMFTDVIFRYREQNPDDRKINILQPQTFYPFDSKGVPAKTRGKVYAKHYWGSTHKSYNNLNKPYEN